METRRASKRKFPSENQKDATRAKKRKAASHRDSNKFTRALEKRDFVALDVLLVKKKLKLPEAILNSALLKAVNEGEKRLVQILLNHGACADKGSETASSALLSAVKHRHIDIVQELLEKGISADVRDTAGKTALILAVEKSGCFALVFCLQKYGCPDIDSQDNDGRTALMIAVERWDFDVVKMLFESCCEDDIVDKNGKTAYDRAVKNGFAGLFSVVKASQDSGHPLLYEAAKTNDVHLVQQLLEMSPSCVHDYPYGDSPLAQVMHGNESEWDGKLHCSFEIIKSLLKPGVCPNDAHKSSGLTPLMYAACSGSAKVAQILLDHNASVHQRNSDGQTPLWMAASKGHAGIVKLLRENDAETLVKDQKGETELEAAIKGGNKACIQVVLSYCYLRLCPKIIGLMIKHEVFDVLRDVQKYWGNLLPKNCQYDPLYPQFVHIILFKALQIKSYPLVKDLMKYGVSVNWCYTSGVDTILDCVSDLHIDLEYGESLCPLFYAFNNDELLQLLLDGGADVNFRHKKKGYTALMHTAVHGDLKNVRLLLEFKADMYAEVNGQTALSLACEECHHDVVSVLLDAGMDVNHLSQTNKTALWYSLHGDDFKTIKLLIEHGANVNFVNTNGITILMESVHFCSVEILELLLKNGAHINMQDSGGNSALFYALDLPRCMPYRRQEKMSLLLRYGANINHMNLSIKTPLMVAAKSYPDLLDTLLTHGPVLNTQDNHGNTALHIAVQHAMKKSLRALVASGADINIVNDAKRSPLMLAVRGLKAPMVETLLNLGADVSFHHSPDVRQVWQTDLNDLLEDPEGMRNYNLYREGKKEKCLKHLLQAGCSINGVQSSKMALFFCWCIKFENVDLVHLLMKSGVGSYFVDFNSWPEAFSVNFIKDVAAFGDQGISPLYAAIYYEKPKIINLFSETCFYHKGDVRMLQHPSIQSKLEELVSDFRLKELCPKNWSLRTRSKLAVLRAVGCGDGRQQRIRALPIPQCLQEELLYTKVSLPEKIDSQRRASGSMSPESYRLHDSENETSDSD